MDPKRLRTTPNNIVLIITIACSRGSRKSARAGWRNSSPPSPPTPSSPASSPPSSASTPTTTSSSKSKYPPTHTQGSSRTLSPPEIAIQLDPEIAHTLYDKALRMRKTYHANLLAESLESPIATIEEIQP